MTDDSGSLGASAGQTGLSSAMEPASSLHPSGFDPSRVVMPEERPLHVIAMQVVKTEPGQTTSSMVLSYRAGVERAEALGSALLAAEREKPGFSVHSWLIYTFDAPSRDSDGSLAEDADRRLSGEAVPARADEGGIAQTPSETLHDS